MLRSTTRFSILLAMLVPMQAPRAADDPCTGFTWDVKRELAVMKQVAQPIAAAAKPSNPPQLSLDRLYDVKLAPQSTVTPAAKPGKPSLDDGQAGMLRFASEKAGRYRIAITSGHWIDVIDGTEVIASRDFQGHRGCERPRKIVEYDLPVRHGLTLQLSGSTDAQVFVSITYYAPVAK